MKIHGTAKGGALSKKDFGVAFGSSEVTPFSPSDISDLVMWFDGSNSGSITKDGSNRVSQWDDLSGNDHNMVQASAGSQPLWVSGAQNSLDVINFDDNARKMANTTTSQTGSQPLTYAMVYKPLGTTISNVVGAGSTRCDYYDWVSESSLHRLYAGAVLNDNNTYGSQYWQLTNIFDGASSKMRRDGSQTSTGDAGSSANNGQAFGSDGAGDGFIMAEFIMYDKEVSDSELDDLETYLADKWGL